ncbi:ZrgA family zinc uptake protein [Salinivibrio sharmensis]|uniref:Zinc-binding protein n=1 Tax=Salinivibrio sharmensis TaxID=390883 RepID=A0ABX3KGW2_9GAMM|nr:DUF2796 domain-containing protein [Salinivibrio sharmensis]OOE88371.1 hypothetical protein BZG74_08795 [Salinivibrio sharmensis]
MKTRFLPNVIAMAIATASTATFADEANYQSFDAHVHGEVTASLAQDGERVLIELTAPGHDVVGFEHHPKNAKDQQTLEDAYALLRDGGKRFQLAEAANCQLAEAKVTSSFSDYDEHHDHDEHHGHDEHDAHHEDHHEHDHGNHNTLSANYQFICQNPQAFTELKTDWFSLFPNTETIKIQAFTDDKVWVDTLNRAKSHIQW